MKAPLRLRDDPSAAPELRSDLERSAQAWPDYDVAAGLAGFQTLTAGQAAAAAAPTGSAAAGSNATGGAVTGGTASGITGSGLAAALTSSAAIKGVLVGAVVAGAAIAAWPNRGPSVPSEPPTAERVVAAGSHAARKAPGSRPTSRPRAAAATAREAAAPTHDTLQNRDPLASAATPRAALSTLDESQRREIAQLGRIKALVEREPERAYALAKQGESEFTRGVLRQEREALAVLALWNMGERTRAQRDARAFLERYPRSPLHQRLEALLELEP